MMTNKIKEIVELLKEDLYIPQEDNREYKLLDKGDDKLLLDYITNLQEQVNEYEQLIDIQDKREYHKRYLEERRKEQPNLLYPDYDEIYKRYYEQKELIDTVIDDLKHFHLIYNEDGKLILSGESILAEIRYFIDKLEGTIPIDMTPFEHDMWEKENRIKGEDNE